MKELVENLFDKQKESKKYAIFAQIGHRLNKTSKLALYSARTSLA